MLQHFCLVKNQVSCNPNTWMITRNLKYVELQIYYSSLYVGPAMSWWLVQAGPHFWPEGTWEKAQPPIHFKANGGRPNFGALHSTEYEKGVWTAPENAVCLFFFLVVPMWCVQYLYVCILNDCFRSGTRTVTSVYATYIRGPDQLLWEGWHVCLCKAATWQWPSLK